MTFNISEYSQGLPFPNYKKTDYSLELEMAVLSKKTQEQQKALQSISAAQNTALNIAMLNLEGKDRLDSYNREIAESLSKDLGDLTKVENQNKIANLFQKISGDTQLIDASKKSREHISEFERIQREKMSGKKDSGYNTINEFVYMNEEGGYYDFMKQSLNAVSDPNYRLAKYTPYKDIRTPLANLTKLLHEDVTKRTSQVLDKNGYPTGYLTSSTIKEISPGRIASLYEAQLGADGMAQLQTLTKYDILRAKQGGATDALYNQYSTFYNTKIQEAENNKKITEGRISFYETELKKTDLSPELRAQYQSLIGSYQNNLSALDSNITNYKSSMIDKNQFAGMSTNDLAPYMYQIKKEEQIKDAVNALSYKEDLQDLKADTTYLAMKKIDAMLTQTKIREENANLRAAAALMQKEKDKKAEEEAATGGGLLPADVARNNVPILESYEKLQQTQNQYALMTDDIITSPSLDKTQLSKERLPAFLKQHEGNFHAQMFGIYQLKHGDAAYLPDGSPNLEGFKLWRDQSIANPEGDPNIETLVSNYEKAQVVADWTTKNLNKINNTLMASNAATSKLVEYAYKADGTKATQSDFAKDEDLFVFVPSMPKGGNESDAHFRARGGNYYKKSLKDYTYDVKMYNTMLQEIQDSQIGSETTGLDRDPNLNRSEVLREIKEKYRNYLYVENDLGLYDIAGKANQGLDDTNLQKVLMETMPQQAQFGMAQLSNKQITPQIANLVSAAGKMSNVAFSPEEIELVEIPVGAGDFGRFKLTEKAVKALPEGTQLPVGPNGDTMADVRSGVLYSFRVPAIMQRDVLFNAAANSMPIKSTFRGYTYEITTQGSARYMKITTPDNQQIIKSASPSSDVASLITVAKNFINTMATQGQGQPKDIPEEKLIH
jgi:hypothetical protein